MSHLKERKEKNCLNCNAEVMGKYCHICGQENIEPKETVLHLVSHFFKDITHFDNKFFSSLFLLIRRPGFLSAEYTRGRRASYLNPIRMYIFTSAFFFLIFFTLFKIDKQDIILDETTINGKKMNEVALMDSAVFAGYTRSINKEELMKDTPMSRIEFKHFFDSVQANTGFHFTKSKYRSKSAYDSVLKAGVEKDNWLVRKFKYKELELNEKYQHNPRVAFQKIGYTLLHKLPQMLFISLPILALILRLLYFRHKEYYYVSHGIFSIHLYIFIFIALLFSFGLGKLDSIFHVSFFSIVRSIINLSIFFYTYRAMRNYYHQGRSKTLVKYFILLLSFLFVLSTLFILFTLSSLFTI